MTKDLGDPRSRDIGDIGPVIASIGAIEKGTSQEEQLEIWKSKTITMPAEDGECHDCGKYMPDHPQVMASYKVWIEKPGNTHALFLPLLCNCPFTTAYAKERRERDSGLHPDSTRSFSNFDTRVGEHTTQCNDPSCEGCYQVLQEAYDKALRLTESNDIPVLTLVGPVGVGKSHLLASACRQALDLGRSARYETSSSIMDTLRSVFSNDGDSLEGYMKWYESKWMLAIDDLGMERGTDFVQERLTMLIEYRIQHRMRTMVSTNLIKSEVEDRYGSRLASRLFSTNDDLIDSEFLIINNVPDYRAKK